MYKDKNITFVFFLIWIPASIFMVFIFLFWLLEVVKYEIEDLFISTHLKDAFFKSIMIPVMIIVIGTLSLIAVGMFPYAIVEYWNISKIILLILLSVLILFGIYLFVISNDENTIGRYAFTVILLGIFVIFPFSRSDTYNQFMAEYYLTGKDYYEAIDYLEFLALESNDDSLREESANLVINLYLKDGYEGSAVSFAHDVNDISDYANYIIGVHALESENLTSATYYLYRASDSYAYKDAYNELQEAIRERGRQLLNDIFIPNDIFDLIPTTKIFKGAKIIKRISKGSNIGQKMYQNHMKKNINKSKEQIEEFERCIKYNSYEECKYKLPN